MMLSMDSPTAEDARLEQLLRWRGDMVAKPNASASWRERDAASGSRSHRRTISQPFESSSDEDDLLLGPLTHKRPSAGNLPWEEEQGSRLSRFAASSIDVGPAANTGSFASTPPSRRNVSNQQAGNAANPQRIGKSKELSRLHTITGASASGARSFRERRSTHGSSRDLSISGADGGDSGSSPALRKSAAAMQMIGIVSPQGFASARFENLGDSWHDDFGAEEVEPRFSGGGVDSPDLTRPRVQQSVSSGMLRGGAGSRGKAAEPGELMRDLLQFSERLNSGRKQQQQQHALVDGDASGISSTGGRGRSGSVEDVDESWLLSPGAAGRRGAGAWGGGGGTGGGGSYGGGRGDGLRSMSRGSKHNVELGPSPRGTLVSPRSASSPQGVSVDSPRTERSRREKERERGGVSSGAGGSSRKASRDEIGPVFRVDVTGLGKQPRSGSGGSGGSSKQQLSPLSPLGGPDGGSARERSGLGDASAAEGSRGKGISLGEWSRSPSSRRSSKGSKSGPAGQMHDFDVGSSSGGGLAASSSTPVTDCVFNRPSLNMEQVRPISPQDDESPPLSTRRSQSMRKAEDGKLQLKPLTPHGRSSNQAAFETFRISEPKTPPARMPSQSPATISNLKASLFLKSPGRSKSPFAGFARRDNRNWTDVSPQHTAPATSAAAAGGPKTPKKSPKHEAKASTGGGMRSPGPRSPRFFSLGISKNDRGGKSFQDDAARSPLASPRVGEGSQEGILRRGLSDLRKRYDVGPKVGEGRQGVLVYECTEKKSGRKVACKSIAKSTLQEAKKAEALRTEVKVMKLLGEHSNTITLRDALEDQQDVHLVMDLCEGGDLLGHINSTPHISEQQAASMCKSLVQVVAYCHDKGVIHRDLKPENILLATKGSWWDLRVADFGISAFIQPGERIRGYAGSPFYIAPEVLEGWYGKEADIWSLGVILYVLLSQKLPFYDESDAGVYRAILKGQVDLRMGPWVGISREAKEIVRSMLCLDPTNRITAAEILEHPWIRSNQLEPPLAAAIVPEPDYKPTRRKRTIARSSANIITSFRLPFCLTPTETLHSSDEGTVKGFILSAKH